MMQMQGGSFCVKKFDEKIFPPLEIQVILDLKCIFCVIIFFSLIVTKTTFFFKKYIADAVQIFSKFYGKVGLILVTYPFHKIFFVLLRFRLENLEYHKSTTTYFFFFYRIRVGRSVEGFGLSPGITRDQRLGLEVLMKSAFAKLVGDLAGKYFPLLGMEEADRQQLVDDHFLFVSGDKNLIAAGMQRDWPEGRGIFHNAEKSFLVWVNEEDQLRIISMQGGMYT